MKKHLTILFIVSIITKLGLIAVFDCNKPYYGMSYRYAKSAYMLSAGLGYSTLKNYRWGSQGGIDWVYETFRELSTDLDKSGKTINGTTELPFDRSEFVAEYFYPPGYPFFLYSVYRIFGEPIFLNVAIIQAIIGSFLPFFVFLIAKQLFNDKIAIYSMWLSSLYPPLLFIQIQQLPDGISILFMIVSLFCFVRGVYSKNNIIWFSICGIVSGMCFMLRSEAFLLPLIYCVVILIGTKKQRTVNVIFILILSAIFILPWTIRNRYYSGYWTFGTGTGVAMIQGLAEVDNGLVSAKTDEGTTKYAKENGFDTPVSPEADVWLRKKAIHLYCKNPFLFIKGVISRMPQVIAAPFDVGFKNPMRTKGFFSYFRVKEKLTFFEIIFKNIIYIIKAFWERIIVATISLFATLSMILIGYKYRHDLLKLMLFFCIPIYIVSITIFIDASARHLIWLLPYQLIALTYGFFEIRSYFLRNLVNTQN